MNRVGRHRVGPNKQLKGVLSVSLRDESARDAGRDLEGTYFVKE
jgi:hypothetical protein